MEVSGRGAGLEAAIVATGIAGFTADCSIFLESSLVLIGVTMPYPAMDDTRGSGVKVFTLVGLGFGASSGDVDIVVSS